MTTRVFALLVLGLALAGCGSTKPPSTHPYTPRLAALYRATHVLPYFVSSTSLAIQTFGSSSCPEVPKTLTVLDPHTIRIDLTPGTRGPGEELISHPPASGICTADYGSIMMTVSLPCGIDVRHSVTLRLDYPDNDNPRVETVPPLFHLLAGCGK